MTDDVRTCADCGAGESDTTEILVLPCTDEPYCADCYPSCACSTCRYEEALSDA